jgi:hypothetical protein
MLTQKLVEMEMVDPLRKLTKSITAWRTFVKSELVCTIAADAFFPSFAPVSINQSFYYFVFKPFV